METILLASKNKAKCSELERIIRRCTCTRYNVLTLNDFPEYKDVEETGYSFEENALIKLNAARQYHLFNDYIIISEDSGLCIPELQGAPGIYSGRYAPNWDESNKRVLREMIGAENREAYLHSAVVVSKPGWSSHESRIFTGIMRGVIADKETGSNGFSYDKLFMIPQYEWKTLAEIPTKFLPYYFRYIAIQQAIDIL